MRTKRLCVLIHTILKMRLARIYMFQTSCIMLLAVPRWCFFLDIFVIYGSCFSMMSCLFPTPVVTCWERADLLALLCVVCVFVTNPYDVPGQVWHLIESIPDICLPLYSHLFST